MKQFYKIDSEGYFIEPVIEQSKPSDCVEVAPPNGLFKAKWEGEEWTEGLTNTEIEAIRNTPAPKTELEILKETVDQLVLDNLMRGF